MKLSNLKNNNSELLNSNNLSAVKGGWSWSTSPFTGGGATTNSTNGDESDKRAKRPGMSAAIALSQNISQ